MRQRPGRLTIPMLKRARELRAAGLSARAIHVVLSVDYPGVHIISKRTIEEYVKDIPVAHPATVTKRGGDTWQKNFAGAVDA